MNPRRFLDELQANWRLMVAWVMLASVMGGGAWGFVIGVQQADASAKAYIADVARSETAMPLAALKTDIAVLSDDVTRQRIETLRLQLGALRAQRPQLDDLRSKNLDNPLLKIQLDQLDADIAEADRMLRIAVCALNQRFRPGFAC